MVDALTTSMIKTGLVELGISTGDIVVVHSSLSAFGYVEGGAQAVIEALRMAVGPAGTIVVPTFTPQTQILEDDNLETAIVFDSDMDTPMGAIATALMRMGEACRSSHPQVSIAAIGPAASHLCQPHRLSFAVGPETSFGRLHDLSAKVLLLGVGHNRNTLLHYAETLLPNRRLKMRRFAMLYEGEPIWVQAPDVGDDNGTYFPTVGQQYNARAILIGNATCTVVESQPFVRFAQRRLSDLLSSSKNG